jgi:hypothetical protein
MENSRAYLFYSALFVIVAVLLLGSLWKIWPIWFPPSQEMSAAALLDASKAIHTLILDGATTQTRGDFVKANAYYSKALSEAQRVNLKPEIIEGLTRKVGLQCETRQIMQVDDLARQAIENYSLIKGTPTCDGIVRSWMNYMADSFYGWGESTTSERMKEACMERYLTVKTASDDKFDPMVAVKYNMLLNNLGASGRYKEKLEWMPKANEYFRRDPSFRNDKDAQQIAIALTHMMMGDVSEGEALLPSWIKERQFQDVSANSNV